MTIAPAGHPPGNPDRATALQKQLGEIVQDVISSADNAGYATAETIKALRDVVTAAEADHEEVRKDEAEAASKWQTYSRQIDTKAGEFIKSDPAKS